MVASRYLILLKIADVTSIVVVKTLIFKNLVCLFGLGKFGENILFIPVAKNPDLKNIVQTLFKHCGHKKPYLVDHDDAVKNLRCLLNKIGGSCPLMLVLDNVFQDSESFVNAFKVQLPYYKILITSRVKFPRFRTSLFLKPLRDEDAVIVFRHFALPNDGTIGSYVPDEDDVQQVCYIHPSNSQYLNKAGLEPWSVLLSRSQVLILPSANFGGLVWLLQKVYIVIVLTFFVKFYNQSYTLFCISSLIISNFHGLLYLSHQILSNSSCVYIIVFSNI